MGNFPVIRIIFISSSVEVASIFQYFSVLISEAYLPRKMNLNSTTEMNLLNTLRTLGVLQNQSTPNPMDITDTGTNSVPNGVACQTLPTVDSVHVAVSQLSRNELLRATQHLVEGLLRVQTRASATAPSYLGVVFPCLFHLTNNEHQDVRIAADEGINKLIKFLRVSMTHQVIFELLLEIKRGQNPRSIVAALSKFAMLTPRIRPSKLRFYTASLLPVLIDVCRRDDESIFKTLIEHFPRIASQLFYHATERELREFLRHQMLRLNSETALIRRAIAQLLVLACQHSRFALPLLQLLLQRVLAELIDPNETISSQRRGGLLNTLRYLAIAWHEVLNANPSSLLDEHPPNSHPRGTVSRPEFRSPATVNGTRLAAHSGTDVRGLGPADSESSSSYTTGTTADNSDSANHWASQLYHQETEVTEIVEQLWSFAFLVSLDLASSSNGITVCTAALEALSQMLQTGCPARLYLRRWVFRDMNWLTTNTPYTGFSSNLSVSSYEPSLIDESEETQNLSIDPLRQLSHSSLDAELSNDILGPSNASEPSLVRSLSSNSLVSLDPPDSEMTEPNQRAQQQQVDEIRKQLSAVRAQLVQQGSLNGINSVATDGDYALVSSEASDDAEADDASAVVSVSGAPLESKSARLLTLREFLAQIVATTRLNSSTSSRDHGFPLSECHWLLDYLVLHFCLVPNVSNIPRPDVLPRTSSQLLAVTCLTRLCRFYPNLFLVPLQLDRCCSQSPGTVDFPTAVDLILDLMEFHSDPQLRGQLCVLSGRLIAAFLTTENLVVSKIVGADLTPNWPDWSKARSQLERLLTGLNTVLATETVGNIVRLAVIGLAHSANAILQFGGRTHHLHSEHQQQQQLVCPPSLVARLLRCLSTYLVKLARHSYRLVRRECMVMIGKLDWHQILYLECQPDTKSSCHNLTRPVRLIDLAWIECWRLLFDPDGDLRAFAADTLLTLSTVLTASGTDTIPAPRHTRLLHHYLERRLHYWFSNSYSLTQAPAVSHGLTECWSSQSYPPCLSDIPIELDVGPASIRHHLPDSVGTNLPYLELINAEDLKHRASLSGSMKLFRQCVSALLELPCASLLTDDRHMLHGVIHCLNRILGQTHILAHTRIWYDECSISPDPSRVNKSSSAAEATTMTTTATNSAGSTDNTPSQSLLDRQRRPRIALLSWHCLTLLSATNVIAVDLELHAEVVSLTTGCLTRWAIHALTEGSISTGPASMSLDLQHAYTRFALSFLHHIARMLFVLWHIVDEITPGPAPSAGLIADPFHPDAPIGILNSISILAQTGANAVAQATQAAANKAVHSAAATATANLAAVGSQTGTTRRGLKLNSPLRKIAHADSTGTNTGPSESRTSPAVRRLLGYFSHLPHYMSIYRTLKSAFQVYKISGDLIGDNDRFMGILRVYLFALSRLMTNIRLAEIAPYSEELLAYVSKLYHWQPAFCLEAASQILRAFVGTNLISHWDEHLARLYNISLNGSYASDQGHCESVDRGQTPMKSTPESGMERVGVLNIMNQLFKRHRNRVGLLSAESSIPISSIAKWTETTAHLSRTPITAWIRFARQWRVPLPLTSRASVIKSELAQFFKVFEHIVLQSMEMYRWTTCSDLQTSILNLLTHLICLRLNYEQLDTGQQFLKTVINHCQNLSLEVQRQTPLSTAKPGFRGCSSNDTFNGSANSRSPAVTITCPQATRQRLVHAMFRFLVSLAYYPQKSKPVEATSATGISSEEGSNVANAAPSPAKLVEFGQVMHMAETLVAEALDPSSVVLSSLAPVVADLFVIQRPLHTTIQKDTAVIAFPTSPEQAEVQREAVLGFMLRRLAHLPASYDQLCLILEEASLNPNVNDGSQPAVIGGDRPSKVVEAIFSAILAHLNSGTAVLNSRNDFSALLRLFDHVLLALTSQPTVNAELCSKMLQQLNKIMIAAVQSRILFDGHTDSIVFRRWAVMHVACTRLFLNLLRLLERSDRAANRTGGASVDRVFDAASPCPGLGQRQDTMDCLKLLSILALPLSVLDAILDATHSHLCSYPQLANQLSLLVLNGTEIADTSAGLFIQLLLNHLISLHDLVESDFYQIALTKFGLWNPVEISWLSDPTWDHDCAQLLTSITNRILLVGHFEPLLCTLWHQFIADIRRSTESYPGETNRMLENLCTAPYPWLNSTSTVLADEIVTQTVLLTYLRESLNQEEKSVTLCHQLFNSASDYAPDWNLISIKRLFTLWQMGEPAVRQFFSQIGQCATSSRLLLEQCARIIPHLSLSDLRISLQLIVGPLHPSVAGQQLAVLWDHFIAPRQQLHDRMDSKCSGCARNPLPLGLQNQAIRAACVQLERLIRVTSSPTGIDGNEAATNLRSVTVPIPLAVLMDYCARLPRHLTLPGLVQLGELLDRLVDKMAPGELSPRQGRVAPQREQSDTVLDVVSVIKRIDENRPDWLLVPIQSLLISPCSITGVRMATRLLQLLVSLKVEHVDQKIKELLRKTCPSCCSRLLQYALTLDSGLPYPGLGQSDKTSPMPEVQVSKITPQMNTLFRMAVICQDSLLDQIQKIVLHPEQLIDHESDCLLRDSAHSRLTGLCIALVHYLRLVPYLAATDAIPIESESLALRFLRILVEFSLYLFGYPIDRLSQFHSTPVRDSSSPETRRIQQPGASLSPSFLHSVLDLMDTLLQITAGQCLKGVDMLGDEANQILATFFAFLAAVDHSASLTQPVTYWACGLQCPVETSSDSLFDPVPMISRLLAPSHPSLFAPGNGWCPDPVPASVIAAFTSLSSSCSASAVFAGPSTTVPNVIAATGWTIEPQGFVQPNQLLGHCRLLRSALALVNESALAGEVNACLIAGSGAAGNPAIRGKGGDGGSVYLEVKEDYSLSRLLQDNPTKRFKASHGKEASKRRNQLIGPNGTDLTISVPSGISVLLGGQGNFAGSSPGTKFVPIRLGDLDRSKQRLLVAQGGIGGSPQTGYIGTAGQSHALILDLKLMADYSLVGFPNAGKSSLLHALSSVPVKIASYPFTTVQPQIAHCKYPDGRMFSLTDLPGLADIYARYSAQPRREQQSETHTGATELTDSAADSSSDVPNLPALRHTNFLKHVERSSCLLLVLDALGFRQDQYSAWRSPLACAYLIMHLLERWSGGYLLEKPMVCVVNKMDLPGAEAEADDWLALLNNMRSSEARAASELPDVLLPHFVPQFEAVYLVSAKTRNHIPELKESLRQHLDTIELRKKQDEISQTAEKQRNIDKKFLFDRETVYC
ncbi:GTP-binding protein 10 [Fasciola hepatica]|uniref:GTP-binding protein 10 n=1 Tax=Fasciola hepatica TaxID=6192 RepID=A0A4E0RER4_FASHE|nr:GTP-binding protein 10 [Fasciola hepatica]